MKSDEKMRKKENFSKNRRIKMWMVLLAVLLITGCKTQDGETAAGEAAEETQETALFDEDIQRPEEKEPLSTPVEDLTPSPEMPVQTPEVIVEEEVLGEPRSSFGLGSASFLKGRNVLVSLFVTTPESGWTEEEKAKMLAKMKIAVDYIESRALEYGVNTRLLFDWSSENSLLAEADTDFIINEDTDFMDRLDEEIVCWLDEKISYENLLQQYNAQGIATCIFVNNPGVSYAIVYDGMDNEQETIVLFAGDYYKEGREETPAVYAHEILHVFGAHDLYEDAEFTKEVADYMKAVYPNELMYTVAGSGQKSIDKVLSPVTAYHLGWLDYTEEIDLFPQLNRY